MAAGVHPYVIAWLLCSFLHRRRSGECRGLVSCIARQASENTVRCDPARGRFPCFVPPSVSTDDGSDRIDLSRFLTGAEVEGFLKFVPPRIREIAFELRSLVASICPQATERILWGGLSYHDTAKGGPVKGAICQIELERHCVRLSFIHGARLRDPASLLEGNRLSKRFVAIDSYDEAPWAAISDLIREASALDPSTFGPLP
jgi:hypothetical protein